MKLVIDNTRNTNTTTTLKEAYELLACRAASLHATPVIIGNSGTAADYPVDAQSDDWVRAAIAAQQTLTSGLRIGLDYHQNAFMVGIETSGNRELMEKYRAPKNAKKEAV